MKKYKTIEKQEFEDKAYELVEKYDLTKEEKENVNILISRYASILQKLNENINNDKFKNIKKEILEQLKDKDV